MIIIYLTSIIFSVYLDISMLDEMLETIDDVLDDNMGVLDSPAAQAAAAAVASVAVLAAVAPPPMPMFPPQGLPAPSAISGVGSGGGVGGLLPAAALLVRK